MRLRVSGEHTGDEYDLRAVNGIEAEAGVGHGRALNGLAEALCAYDPALAERARAEVERVMGSAALVDAAAVIASFNAYPRMADATGIPLEDAKAELTAALRRELGLDRLDRNREGAV